VGTNFRGFVQNPQNLIP